ncbi:CHAP domain-containing protein [Frankia sp. AiPs1]|uniref:CHAP domain-containing protein n=1 Tax=Frankia sp. AiPs1 TaxID=573493 RepID=UPI002043D53D|nr:CHAP domain-containing protein [Frankia sp. AiPs1]MCM3923168.1 CHAP domain-containing protein [Frankia sp. AiPs1]
MEPIRMLFRGRRRCASLLTAVVLAAGLVATVSAPASAATAASNLPLVGIAATPTGTGYWQVASDGGVFTFGDAAFYGSMGGKSLNKPVVGIAATPTGRGYWLVASDGGVFAFGDAAFHGSLGSRPLGQPVVGIAATPTGRGYWLVASDGGVFAFGDARLHGSMAGQHLNAAVTGIAAAPSGAGYWLVAGDGGVFSFGVPFYGSMGGRPLNSPVTAIVATGTSHGYLLAGADGGVFAFGDAAFRGSMGGKALAAEVNAIAITPGGYWLSAADGGIFAFGAPFYGRASYIPPRVPSTTPAGQAANLALGWKGHTWTGVNGDYWNAPVHGEYWCVDFATYTWQKAGINVPHYINTTQLTAWAQKYGHWLSLGTSPQVGDLVVYPSHVGVIVQVFPSNGTVVSVDGDFGGEGSSEKAFASSSHAVQSQPWSPSSGRGTAGTIKGYVRAG